MKRQFLSAISKLTFGLALFTGVALTQARANSTYPIEKNAEVKYLGVSDDAVLFKVSFDNPSNNKFVISVVDEDGNQLFQGVYTDKKFDKRFILPKSDKQKLTFIIRNAKDVELNQTFEISTHFVEDVVVTRL
ncbi:MAG: hypothetical protein ACHQET_05035 [Chitinophagales bacterium]